MRAHAACVPCPWAWAARLCGGSCRLPHRRGVTAGMHTQAWGHGDAHTCVGGSRGDAHTQVWGHGDAHTGVGSRGNAHTGVASRGCTHTGVGSRADAHTGVDRCVRVPGVHMHALCTDVLSAHTDTRSSLWWHDHAGIAWGRGWLLCSVGVARVTWPVVQL